MKCSFLECWRLLMERACGRPVNADIARATSGQPCLCVTLPAMRKDSADAIHVSRVVSAEGPRAAELHDQLTLAMNLAWQDVMLALKEQQTKAA